MTFHRIELAIGNRDQGDMLFSRLQIANMLQSNYMLF